jgi:hypothetical protein
MEILGAATPHIALRLFTSAAQAGFPSLVAVMSKGSSI